MYLYFGLNINDIADFCELVNEEENRGYEVNDKVFIDIDDGIFTTRYIAKLIHYVNEKSFVIIGFDEGLGELKPNNRITLKSFKDQNKEIRLKVFNAASNVNIRDNFKYTVRDNSIKSEDDTKSNSKQTYYFTLTKDEHKCFVYRRYDGTLLIKTAIWNVDHTNFTLEDVPVVQVMTVSISSDLSIFRILDFDSRNFVVSKDSYNAYRKTIYSDNSDKIVEFFTDLDDCIRFTKTKKEEPKITNKLEEQWSWDCKPLNMSKKKTKSLKSEYPYFGEHWLDNYMKERPEFPPINTYVKYSEADVKFASKLYEERRMTIKDIKKNGPATIIFWLDGDKTVVKCQPGDQDDIEKGVIMALVKGIFQKYKGTNNWTEAFKIPYADEIDVEKVIGLALLRDHYGNFMKDPEWHYNYVLKWVYKIKGYEFKDEVKALTALGYSRDRIKKCLNTNLGAIRDALEPKTETETKKSNVYTYADALKDAQVELEQYKLNPEEETKEESKDVSMSDKVMEMFNKGIKIAQIAKKLGITEYFVKKALDEITKPKSNPKKTERILKKATKEKIVHKKHVRRTEIEYPDYLDKETCDMVLERTKEKYKNHDKIQYLSELQKYFIMECKREYIITHYGNGYDMYTIAKVLGINAASVQRIWNAFKSGKEKQCNL